MYIIHLINVNKSNLLQKISKFKYKNHLVLLYKINRLSIRNTIVRVKVALQLTCDISIMPFSVHSMNE